MLNQGDAVGNKKGLVGIVTTNGGVQPMGMTGFSFGVFCANFPVLSGNASAGLLGAAAIKAKHLI